MSEKEKAMIKWLEIEEEGLSEAGQELVISLKSLMRKSWSDGWDAAMKHNKRVGR